MLTRLQHIFGLKKIMEPRRTHFKLPIQFVNSQKCVSIILRQLRMMFSLTNITLSTPTKGILLTDFLLLHGFKWVIWPKGTASLQCFNEISSFSKSIPSFSKNISSFRGLPDWISFSSTCGVTKKTRFTFQKQALFLGLVWPVKSIVHSCNQFDTHAV